MNISGVVTPALLRGGIVGGHCVLFSGYQSDVDSSGNKMLDQLQSWGTTWGQAGWAQWTSDAVESVSAHPDTELIGITNITGFSPERLIDFSKIV